MSAVARVHKTLKLRSESARAKVDAEVCEVIFDLNQERIILIQLPGPGLHFK